MTDEELVQYIDTLQSLDEEAALWMDADEFTKKCEDLQALAQYGETISINAIQFYFSKYKTERNQVQ